MIHRYDPNLAEITKYFYYALCWFPVAMYLGAAINSASAIPYARSINPNMSGDESASISVMGPYGNQFQLYALLA